MSPVTAEIVHQTGSEMELARPLIQNSEVPIFLQLREILNVKMRLLTV
jgi:hypothetical protein